MPFILTDLVERFVQKGKFSLYLKFLTLSCASLKVLWILLPPAGGMLYLDN